MTKVENLDKAHAFYGVAKDGVLKMNDYGVPMLFADLDEADTFIGYEPVEVIVVVRQ